MAMWKASADWKIKDEDILSTECPDQGAVLADNGYQRVEQTCQIIILYLNPTKLSKKRLSNNEKKHNANVFKDKIIVRNYFGRCKTLWNICKTTYTWGEKEYDVYYGLFVALKSYHIQISPLRRKDSESYKSWKQYLNLDGTKSKDSHQTSRDFSRKRREDRMKPWKNSGQYISRISIADEDPIYVSKKQRTSGMNDLERYVENKDEIDTLESNVSDDIAEELTEKSPLFVSKRLKHSDYSTSKEIQQNLQPEPGTFHSTSDTQSQAVLLDAKPYGFESRTDDKSREVGQAVENPDVESEIQSAAVSICFQKGGSIKA